MEQINDLILGFERFRTKYYLGNSDLIQEIGGGQQPRFLIVACSDSRTDPAILFDAAPGDLFVIRNVANLVPPYVNDSALHGVSSALEFGVKALKVRHLLVLGHSQCAGIRALMIGWQGEFVSQWMQIAEPARQRVTANLSGASMDAQLCACEKEAIVESLANLMSFPWIRERVEKSEIFLHGLHFDIQLGTLTRLDSQSNQFLPLTVTKTGRHGRVLGRKSGSPSADAQSGAPR